MDLIFLNGKWVSKEGAVKLSVFDQGFMFGDSVLRSYQFPTERSVP